MLRAVCARVPSLDPPRLLQLSPPRADRPVIRLGISANSGGHTRELCAGCAVAIEEWRKTDPPYDVEVLWEEDALHEDLARMAAGRLVSVGVDLVIGHLSSTAALPAAAVYHEARVPYLAPGTSHPLLTGRGYWNVLRFCGRDDYLANRIAQFATALGIRRLGMVWQEILYGRTLAELVEQSCRELGIEVVERWGWNSTLATSVTATLMSTRMTQQQVGAVFYAGTYQVGAVVLKQLRNDGYTGPVIMGDDAFIAELSLMADEAAEGAYVVSTGAHTAHPEYQAFCDRYQLRAGLAPGAYSVTSYCATQAALDSLEPLVRKQPRRFLEQVRERVSRGDTLLGNVQFAANGDLLRFEWDLYQIRSSSYKLHDVRRT